MMGGYFCNKKDTYFLFAKEVLDLIAPKTLGFRLDLFLILINLLSNPARRQVKIYNCLFIEFLPLSVDVSPTDKEQI